MVYRLLGFRLSCKSATYKVKLHGTFLIALIHLGELNASSNNYTTRLDLAFLQPQRTRLEHWGVELCSKTDSIGAKDSGAPSLSLRGLRFSVDCLTRRSEHSTRLVETVEAAGSASP